MYAPGVQYDARPLYEGLASAGRSIAAARDAELQRQFLTQQLQQQQAYGWGIHADEVAKDYYSMGLQNDARKASLDEEKRYHDAEMSNRARALDITEKDNAPYTPPPQVVSAAAKAGYLWAAESNKGGTWIPRKDNSAELPALGSDPTNSGQYFWNGKQLMRNSTNGVKMTPLDQISLGQLDDKIAEKQKEMGGLAGQSPDKNTGLLGLWGPTVAEKQRQQALDLQELQAKRNAMLSRIKMGGGSPAPGGEILPPADFQPASKPTGAFFGPAPTPPSASYGGYANPPPTRTPPPTGARPQLPFAEPQLPTGGVQTPAPFQPPAYFDSSTPPPPPTAGFYAPPTTPRPQFGGTLPSATPLPDQLPQLRPATPDALQLARAAIARGANPIAVKQRLAAAGIDPTGL